MINKMGTQSPKGAVCAKCGEPIETGLGRRYRMKWMHEHCLPETRLGRIDHYREDVSREKGAVAHEKRLEEERERIRHQLNKLRSNTKKPFSNSKHKR